MHATNRAPVVRCTGGVQPHRPLPSLFTWSSQQYMKLWQSNCRLSTSRHRHDASIRYRLPAGDAAGVRRRSGGCMEPGALGGRACYLLRARSVGLTYGLLRIWIYLPKQVSCTTAGGGICTSIASTYVKQAPCTVPLVFETLTRAFYCRWRGEGLASGYDITAVSDKSPLYKGGCGCVPTFAMQQNTRRTQAASAPVPCLGPDSSYARQLTHRRRRRCAGTAWRSPAAAPPSGMAVAKPTTARASAAPPAA